MYRVFVCVEGSRDRVLVCRSKPAALTMALALAEAGWSVQVWPGIARTDIELVWDSRTRSLGQVELDPHLAAEFGFGQLEEPRAVDETIVNQYAAALLAGKWKVPGGVPIPPDEWAKRMSPGVVPPELVGQAAAGEPFGQRVDPEGYTRWQARKAEEAKNFVKWTGVPVVSPVQLTAAVVVGPTDEMGERVLDPRDPECWAVYKNPPAQFVEPLPPLVDLPEIPDPPDHAAPLYRVLAARLARWRAEGSKEDDQHWCRLQWKWSDYAPEQLSFPTLDVERSTQDLFRFHCRYEGKHFAVTVRPAFDGITVWAGHSYGTAEQAEYVRDVFERCLTQEVPT